MNALRFSKMHGLGNDFMVVDAVRQDFSPENAPLAAWANRHTGIGFDQFLLVEKPQSADADFRYRIFNADGSEVEQCGNGARCFAVFVRQQGLSDKDVLRVETAKGLIVLKIMDDDTVLVDMGVPHLALSEIPFVAQNGADETAIWQTVRLDEFTEVSLSCVNMGNPHGVLLVDDVDVAPVAEWGSRLMPHPQFPERANIGFMQIVRRDAIRLRVYERGVGETLACGTGACAAVVAGIRAGLLDSNAPVSVALRGGTLQIEWAQSGTVLMRGAAQTVFEGKVAY